jgi:HAD superfamily hydrolase (TIGR01509 family)
VKALLFDLDDTLLDYSGGVDACWDGACAAVTLPDGVTAADLARALVASRRWFWSDPDRHRRERTQMLRAWAKIVHHALGRVRAANGGARLPEGDEPLDPVALAVAEEYAARRRAAMRLFPEARAVLERVRAEGVPLGLVTNGDASQQRDKIDRFELARFFDVVVIEGEFGAGKPDARVFRHALDALGARAEQTAMVGDHLDWDVAGAQRLGMTGIWVDREGGGLPDGSPVRPDRIVRALTEL